MTAVGNDTGTSGSDGITSDATLTVQGTAEGGSSVDVFLDGEKVGTVTAASGGAWSLDLEALDDGTYELTAVATDAAGNVSATSSVFTLIVDAVAPAAPVITGISEDTEAGADGVTSDNDVLLSGFTPETEPLIRIEVHPLSPDGHYHERLSQGDVDVVVGNWLQPPGELHRAGLFTDEVVCLVSQDHPAVRRGWTVDDWLACEHIAPTPTHPGARGIIDEHLEGGGLARN